MSQLMNELHQDHQQITVLLTILKNKLATLENGARPNFVLMSEVLDYLADYAASHHHDREDVLYQYLIEHCPNEAELIAQQLEEHHVLAQLTGELAQAVQAVMMDAPLSLMEFSKRLRRYVQRQQQHLSLEEHRIFPLAQRCLSRDDWQQLSRRLPAGGDPLIENQFKQRYRELTQALIEDLT